MKLSQIVALLEQAMASEQQFITQFLRREEFWRAAQAQARWQALAAFKEVLLTYKAKEKDADP